MADGHTASEMDTARGTRVVNENGTEIRQRDGNIKDIKQRNNKTKKDYLKEATVSVDISNVNTRAEDIIKAVTGKIGKGNILAVRPKQNKEYEVTLENTEDVDLLGDGLQIKETMCEVKRLQNRDCVVSFRHLPVYIDDREILDKLEG